ncbi:response regulator [Luteibacter sp. 9133]|uniref:response regulator n=1 Tax=Luteibacter sp. 9133 TaxID=1500891 RepID=UPI00068D9DB9|nr:response regulator [Luteibacter sp. 9133]
MTSQVSGASRSRAVDQRTSLALIVVIVFFLVTGLLAWQNIRSIRDNNEKVIHSQQTVTALSEILSSAQDAETGQRGFLLTGNDRYLEPYRAAVAGVPARLDTVREALRDNPAQLARLKEVGARLGDKFAELKTTIELRQTQGFDAAVAVVNSDRGKAAMDAIRSQLGTMQTEELALRDKRVAEMTSAYSSALTSGILSALLGVALTVVVGVLIRNASRARQRSEWLQAGQLELASVMRGDQGTDELGANVLAFLARFLNAQAGALFVNAATFFERIGVYGLAPGHDTVERFLPTEGLLGQAAAEQRMLVVNDVPDGYLSVGSALGKEKPRQLVMLPVLVDGEVNGVLELGFFRPIDDDALTLLDEVASDIGVALRSATYRAELSRLLEETRRQSDSLQHQSEELRASNEELEEQSRALKQSQHELEQQQAELEQTNAHLEEQASQLEVQRDDLYRANEQIEAKAEEVQRASRYKSDFLANMSHELRTPLNSALILSKLLADNPRGNLTEEQVKFARTIHSSGNDLLTLINDILDLSKIEAGHIAIQPEPFAVDRMVNGLIPGFQPIAEQKGLSFEVTMSPGCPAVLDTDRQRLEQILRNLLSNAFKFTEEGGVRVDVSAGTQGDVVFTVSDTGIGIPIEQQRRIFDAFQQADGTISRKYGGTGLGLSISVELSRLLGGGITVESEVGQGSTFILTLPLSIADAGVDAAASSASPARPRIAASGQGHAPPPRVETPAPAPTIVPRIPDDREDEADNRRVILVIEDDEAFARIVLDLVREMNFRGLVATSAQEALALARKFLPHAIVLDVGLPDQSGLSVLDILKRDVRTRHIPIHVVSAEDHSHAALSMGAIGYLIKPVRRPQLVEVLDKLDARLSRDVRRVLVVEDDDVQRDAIRSLLSTADVETVDAGTAAECLELLKSQTFDCMVLDLSLPDASGLALLETLSAEGIYAFPPVIVYTGRDLTAEEESRLRVYSRSIIIKGAKSPERLLDEVSLFLHQVVTDLPAEHQRMIQEAQHRDAVLEGRRILVVEDDVRNVYALINILEPRGCVLTVARNGKEAIEALNKAADVDGQPMDLVLMDVMMPVMDGLTATRHIRSDFRWKKLPIITLTAKAMPDDQETCLAAGASDYMAKPLDVDKLLSLVRVWLAR